MSDKEQEKKTRQQIKHDHHLTDIVYTHTHSKTHLVACECFHYGRAISKISRSETLILAQQLDEQQRTKIIYFSASFVFSIRAKQFQASFLFPRALFSLPLLHWSVHHFDGRLVFDDGKKGAFSQSQQENTSHFL